MGVKAFVRFILGVKTRHSYHPPAPRLAAAVLAFGLAAASALSVPGVAKAAEAAGTRASAVVFMYHRFGEDTVPSTNIGLDQFEAHIAELTAGHYNVMGLPEIVAALREGRPLPDRTVAITIDDAYLSAYREAWPRLRAAGLPFTLFVATADIDRNTARYMNWDQLREMAAAGVTIGNQTHRHGHLPLLSRAEIREEFEKSNARLREELGIVPRLQAYPYGEASTVAMEEARRAGFVASFGQHSGVIHGQGGEQGMSYLPRFALNENYGSMDRFRLAANALPLFATEITPANPTLGPNPPPLGFTVARDIGDLGRLACYSSAHGQVQPVALGGQRIEVRLPGAFPPGRGRVNCTMPAGDGRWRWFGYQFFIPPS